MKTMYHTVPTLALLISVASFSVRAADAGTPPSNEQINNLIAQLDHDEFEKREQAMSKIIAIGEPALPFLKKTLEDKKISQEVDHRIRYLLGALLGPEHGVVWRTLITPGLIHNEKSAVPAGIQPGDVIISVDDSPIDSVAAAERFRNSPHQNAKTKVWRKGQTVEINLTTNTETSLCFHVWPDPIREYEIYGHKGTWDQTVIQALAIGTMYSNSHSEPLYQQAYNAGCRDAMVIYFWANHLTKLGKLDEALKIIVAAEKEKLHDNPSGNYLYSELPVLHSRVLCCLGKFDEAKKILAAAMPAAQSNGAFKATKMLKYYLLRAIRYEEKPDPLAYLTNSKDFPYDVLAMRDVATWCQFVSADGDPSRAIKLLEFLRPKLERWRNGQDLDFDELLKYYQSQDQFAKTFNVSPAAKMKEVPVMIHYGAHFSMAPAGRYVEGYSMPVLKMPGSIQLHMNFMEFPKDYAAFAPVFRFGCGSIQSENGVNVSVAIDHQGAYAFQHRVQSQERDIDPELFIGGMAWGDTFGEKAIKISFDEGRTQITINGRKFRTYYGDRKVAEELSTFILCSTATASHTKFVEYAHTSLDVDPAAISDAWKNWINAYDEGGIQKTDEMAKKLIELLKPIPEAKRGIEFIETVMRNSRAVLQPNGWHAEPQAVLKDPQTGTLGLWTASGEWLVGMNSPTMADPKLYCQIPMILPKNFELSGQVAAEGNLCPHIAFIVLWNNNFSGSAGNSSLIDPIASVAWTQPREIRGTQTPAQSQAAQAFINRMKQEKTFSFCLRKVGNKAAIFVNGTEGPLATFDYNKDEWYGLYLCLHQNCPHGLFMMRDIKARAIDSKTDLNAPVQFPEIKPVPTRADLKDLYDRANKIKEEMKKAEGVRKN